MLLRVPKVYFKHEAPLSETFAQAFHLSLSFHCRLESFLSFYTVSNENVIKGARLHQGFSTKFNPEELDYNAHKGREWE